MPPASGRTLMNPQRRSLLATIALASALGLSAPSLAQQKEVRWGQWKGTEVGEKFMAEFKAAFEKDHPDIKLVPVDSPFTGFHDRAIVLHQAKKLPDVLLAQVDWIAEFADLGMLEPLDERIAKEPKDFFDNIPATFHQKWRGKQYYLPIESGAVALFYNTDLFKAAEIAGPPKTWAEFAEISRKLTNPEKRTFAVTATLQAEPPTNMTYDIYPLLLQAGAKIIDAAANKAVFKGPWGVAIQKQLNPKLNYDIAPLPAGTTTGTMVRGSLNTLTSQAQDKEAAWTFMRWMSGPKGIEMWAKGTGAFPARTDVSSQDWFKERPL